MFTISPALAKRGASAIAPMILWALVTAPICSAAPVVHYFEGQLTDGGPCILPICEGLENGSAVRGYFWLDSEATDIASDSATQGVYRSSGPNAGISVYLEANNQWLHADNAQYAIQLFPETTNPGVTVQTFESPITEGLLRIAIAFCKSDLFYFRNDSLQTLDFNNDGCTGESLVLTMGNYLGFTTLVRAVPTAETLESRSALGIDPESLNIPTPIVLGGSATVRIKPLENLRLTKIAVRGRPLVAGSPAILQWRLKETNSEGIPIDATASDRVVLQTIGTSADFAELETGVSMQDAGGEVRNVTLEKDKFYELTLTPITNGWDTLAGNSDALPEQTSNGLFEVLAARIEQLGSVSGGRFETWLTTVPTGDDSDGDLVPDFFDSCTETANANERDTDGDGFGNSCDGDFDQNCIINFVDLGVMRAFFFLPGDLITDLNGDMQTNFVDLGILRSAFFEQPGPSALTDQCSD